MGSTKSYEENRLKEAYNYYVNHKLFKKARTISFIDKKLCLIKDTHKDGSAYYLLPGGGVEVGETTKQAAVREALEEYNIVVKNPKYFSKHYYGYYVDYAGKHFKSRRVEYYYLCEFDSYSNSSQMGLEGEFEDKNEKYEKVLMPLEEVLKTDHSLINSMPLEVYNKLISYMKSL